MARSFVLALTVLFSVFLAISAHPSLQGAEDLTGLVSSEERGLAITANVDEHESDLSRRTTSSARLTQSLKRKGVYRFLGKNGPGYGSWFATNDGKGTNGHSWCGYPYNDNSPIFAPDVSVMLSSFGGNYEKAAKAYCGLEAIVRTPQGQKMRMYIGDGFDPAWVRAKGSIDIAHGTFNKFYKPTNDKNVVINGVTWKLTGRRSKQYCFKCAGQ